jgi:hypothetical protein
MMVVSHNQKLAEGQKINIKLFDYGFGIPFLVKSTIPKGVAVTVSERTSLHILGRQENYKKLKNEMLIPETLNALNYVINTLRNHEQVLTDTLDVITKRFETIVIDLDKIVGRIEALEKKQEK